MPYTRFRYIAYEVPTATHRLGQAVKPLAGLPPGKLSDPVADITVPKTAESTDWFIRLRRLAAVVNIALANLGNDDADTLKVFVAPEFYLRPADPATSHTYPAEQFPQIWDALERMFRTARLKHWLIVPGSVLWHSEMMGENAPIYYNSVLYLRGGTGGGEAGRVEKKLASAMDGVPAQAAVGSSSDPLVKKAYSEAAFVRERLFEIDANATFGLEICLDHRLNVLKQTLADRQADIGDPWKRGGPALHVLTAGGMPLRPGSVAARSGGYVLRNDGYADPPASELRKVTGYQLPSTAPGQPWDDKAVATLEADPGTAVEVTLRGDAVLVPPIAGPGTYDMPVQRLRIYPPLPLP
ncbi:hypothetical protein [Amycolatopsis sp. SID8362]|uniref:hypothetical protein n=1 Tax=Amycolatopsis sp. SID8362 TaxID=2690346 RepID=UPI0013691FBD|nr:hypothetical protein [Amycolatopsis sp. SID8362]NBH12437.1 hypothetical protein [Amycolatopsis sp. SID8362]NED49129.1 hypothetical protein [Amycolatopsis sp. SID8362]